MLVKWFSKVNKKTKDKYKNPNVKFGHNRYNFGINKVIIDGDYHYFYQEIIGKKLINIICEPFRSVGETGAYLKVISDSPDDLDVIYKNIGENILKNLHKESSNLDLKNPKHMILYGLVFTSFSGDENIIVKAYECIVNNSVTEIISEVDLLELNYNSIDGKVIEGLLTIAIRYNAIGTYEDKLTDEEFALTEFKEDTEESETTWKSEVLGDETELKDELSYVKTEVKEDSEEKEEEEKTTGENKTE